MLSESFFLTFLDATPSLPSGRYMPGIIFLPPVGEESQFASRLNGHKFEQTPEDSERQGNLMCCSPWGHKELDMTEPLNNNKSCLLGVERAFQHHHSPTLTSELAMPWRGLFS